MFSLTRNRPVPEAEMTRLRDPFAAIPLRPDCVDLKTDSAGRIHLRLRAAPVGLAGRIARWVGYDYTRKVELDDCGTLYYSQVDGSTPLSSIVDRLAAHLGCGRREAEERAVLFTRKLMTMNLLALKVPPQENAAS